MLEFFSLSKDCPPVFKIEEQKILESAILMEAYYREYYSENYRSVNTVVFKDKKFIGFIFAAVMNNKLMMPEGACLLNLDINCTKKDIRHIVEYIELLAIQNNVNEVVIKDLSRDEFLSDLGEVMLEFSYNSELKFELRNEFDNFNESKYRVGIRKSYKSLINWGAKNIELSIINKDNIDFEAYEEFRKFHIKVAKRETRSLASWQKQFEILKEGYAELLMGRLNGKLVSCSYIADIFGSSYYFTGVYERELFDFGITHFLLYQAIIRSALRDNSKSFILGYFENNLDNKKLYNIQFFKSGFVNKKKPVIFWSKKFF